MRAVRSHDARFDGWFFTAVTTTGIYCRPSCPVRPPKANNMQFFPTAAAAQQVGYRACKRCRPDASPGSPEWNQRGDVVARAMRLIADGVIETDGVAGLAAELGYSERQIERHLRNEVGAGPLALARAQRAQIARTLIETTSLPMSQVADGAGFSSLRSFNEVIRSTFAMTPTELRRNTGSTDFTSTVGISLRLTYRAPLCVDSLFGHLVATAVPGIEEWRDGCYRRTMRLHHGCGVVALRPAEGFISCRLVLDDLRDLNVAVNRCRFLLDLDADPVAIDQQLSEDPHMVALIAVAGGRRVPHTVDGNEMAVRAVLGQQVSTAAARTHAARLVAAHGKPINDPEGGLTHVFPTVQDLSGLDPATLALPQARRRTLLGLVEALAADSPSLGPGCDRQEVLRKLQELPGVGPWTANTIAMRALGDPDAFIESDLGLLKAATDLGVAADRRELLEAADAWRPWRSYAVQYLWSALDHDINRLPRPERKAG